MAKPAKSRIFSQMTAKGALADGFRVLTGRSMIAVLLASAVATTMAIALVGPIGFYYRESPFERMAYGLIYMGLIWPVFYAQMVLVYYFLRRRTPAEILALLLFSMLPASFIGSSVVHSVEGIIHPGYEAETAFVSVILLHAVASISCALLYFYLVWQRVFGTGTAAAGSENGRRATGHDRSEGDGSSNPADEISTAGADADSNGTSGAVAVADGTADESEPPAESPSAPASGATAAGQAESARQLAPYRPAGQPRELFRLLPDGLGTDLIFIKSEDHYLEVHTTAGSSLIKMRFSDAIAELGDRGIKVHRSYWVATGHVTRAVRAGKRTVLRLTGDHRVPVSVTHLRAVRAIISG